MKKWNRCEISILSHPPLHTKSCILTNGDNSPISYLNLEAVLTQLFWVHQDFSPRTLQSENVNTILFSQPILNKTARNRFQNLFDYLFFVPAANYPLFKYWPQQSLSIDPALPQCDPSAHLHSLCGWIFIASSIFHEMDTTFFYNIMLSVSTYTFFFALWEKTDPYQFFLDSRRVHFSRL